MNNSSQVDVSKRDVIMNEIVLIEKNNLNKSKTKWSQRGGDDEEDGAAVNDEDDEEEENENEEHKSKKSTSSSSSSRQMTTASPRNHSRSRSSSSLANVVKQQQQQRKCASCIIWQNIYQVFEFLTNGRLLVDEQDYNEMYIGSSSVAKSTTNSLVEPIVINLNDAASINTSNKYDYLFNLLAKLKFIKNPVDPTECSSSSFHWSWDYKSPKHYKLLKLKLKLLTQIIHLSKLFHMNSSSSSNSAVIISAAITGSSSGVAQCKQCLSSLKDKRTVELKNATIHRLTEYARSHLVELDATFERYMHIRLKNSFDINSLADLNTFMRGQTSSGSSNFYETTSLKEIDNSESLKRVEQCSSKIHILLDLLVSENTISKIFKSESPSDLSLNNYVNSSLALNSGLENGISRGSSGSNFYRTNKEFSNISNHPYSGRPPLQVQHRNSNDSWPTSPSSMSGTGYGMDLKDDKLGFSSRLGGSSSNHHHHHYSQYNQYHRTSSQQQQQQPPFNCNYMSSSSSSTSRGRVNVSTNGVGYYDSMSSKLMSNNQNYSGHYGSLASSYSSSLNMKSYRYDQNIDASSLSPLRNSSSMNRRSYGVGNNYYPSDYSSGGYEYSKYESSRQRNSANNIGNYSLNQTRSTYGLNASSSNNNNNAANSYDLESRLAYNNGVTNFSQGNGLNSSLNLKYGRDYNSKQTCGYSSPSYSNNTSNTKSSKYMDDYHNHYQRHRSSSSEQSLSRNHYHNSTNSSIHHNHSKASKSEINHQHYRSHKSSTSKSKSSKSRHVDHNQDELSNCVETSTTSSSKTKTKTKKRKQTSKSVKERRSNSISSLASSALSINSSSPKFSTSSSCSLATSECDSNESDFDINTSSNLSDVLTSSSETNRLKKKKKNKSEQRKRDTKSSRNKNKSTVDFVASSASLGSLATKMKSKKFDADRKKRKLESKKKTSAASSSSSFNNSTKKQVRAKSSDEKLEKSKSFSSIKSSECSSLSLNETRQLKSRSQSPGVMVNGGDNNNEKKRKRMAETVSEKNKGHKRNKKSSLDNVALSEREEDARDEENAVSSTTDSSFKSRNNSFSLMTEIKKNETNEKNQKLAANTSKSSKRSSLSSSSSLSSLKKNSPVEMNITNTSLNKSNEAATTAEESSTINPIVSSSNIEHDIEKSVDEKKKNLSQKIETTATSTITHKQEVCTNNENGGGILILVDFELTHADKKSKKSHATQRSSATRLDAELESLSQILPILACKLTNFNLHEYIEDYDRKYLHVDIYTNFIHKLVSQLSSTESENDESGEFKQKLFAMELDSEDLNSCEKQTKLLADLKTKVNLVQRLRTECLTRLDMQKKYLTDLRNLFLKTNTEIANFVQKQKQTSSVSSSEEKNLKNFYVNLIQKLKKNIYRMQVSLVEYARVCKQNEKYNLVNALPFNFLFNIMDRFKLIYDLV